MAAASVSGAAAELAHRAPPAPCFAFRDSAGRPRHGLRHGTWSCAGPWAWLDGPGYALSRPLCAQAEIVELVRDGLRRTHDPAMLNASIAMLPMLTRTDAIAHVNERVARLEAELVEQAKWREHPNRDTPEHVREQAELWAGHARTELEWAKSLSKRLSEGAYTMADDPGSWRTVHDPLKMRF